MRAIRILLVEDDEMNRDMLTRRLQRHGFEVVTAVDGEAALAASASQEVDLVLMDIGLPTIDGFEVTRRMRARAGAEEIPIIALTAHATEEMRSRCLREGCQDFATKPVMLASLLEKIQALTATTQEGSQVVSGPS